MTINTNSELRGSFEIIYIYIYIKPIKSDHLPNRYPPLDLAEMKSGPFRLTKITAFVVVFVAVPRGYGRFLYLVVTSIFCYPLSP
ncbi:hypothetical protein Hanom_Chr04g00323371 [Helianthus anomalus]